jgi:hypothetical protein
MEFKAHTLGVEEYYQGTSRYEIGAGNAVLTVSGDNGKKIVYAPRPGCGSRSSPTLRMT